MCQPILAPKDILQQTTTEMISFFAIRDEETKLNKVTERVWTHQWVHYTSTVIIADNGIIVIDPINRRAATLLNEALAKELPDMKVHTVIYSHEHLDHAQGAEAFAPKEIIGHEYIPIYLKDYPKADMPPPTRLLKGVDQTLTIDGIDIELLHLPKSHTETLFAIHIPTERALFAVDLGTVKTMPFILMDMYLPGVIRAHEKIAQVDFDHYIPGHFHHGTKEDAVYDLGFFKDVRQISRDALDAYGGLLTPQSAYPIFEKMYDDLQVKHGQLHGFDQLYMPFLTRMFLAEWVGF